MKITQTEPLFTCRACGAMTPRSRKKCVKCGTPVPPAVLASARTAAAKAARVRGDRSESTARDTVPLEDLELLHQRITERQLTVQREWLERVGEHAARERAAEKRRGRIDTLSYYAGMLVGLLGFGLLVFFMLVLFGWEPARGLLMRWTPG